MASVCNITKKNLLSKKSMENVLTYGSFLIFKESSVKRILCRPACWFGQILIALLRPKKIILLFLEIRVTRKVFTRAASNLFFWSISRRYSLFFFSFFCFFGSCFFLLFVSCFLKLKNVCSDTQSTMRADEW